MTGLSVRRVIQTRLRGLSFWRRMRALGVAAFCSFFLVAMLVRGVGESSRGPTGPLLDWYGSGLGLARTWGMFARPGDGRTIFIDGQTQAGERVQLSPPVAETWAQRYRDQHMRKLRFHLSRPGVLESLRPSIRAYYCRVEGPRGAKLEEVRVVEVSRASDAAQTVIARESCP